MLDKILADFFDFSKPCPSEVPFCGQLRDKYQKELNTVSSSGCSKCQKNNVKAKYMSQVWEQYVKDMVDKKADQMIKERQ